MTTGLQLGEQEERWAKGREMEEKRAKQTLPQGLPRGHGATRAGNTASQEGHRPVGGDTGLPEGAGGSATVSPRAFATCGLSVVFLLGSITLDLVVPRDAHLMR